MKLASRFAAASPALRSDTPLSDYEIRTVAPSIFAEAKHESRSERFSYISTGAVLTSLRAEGFFPFMVAQTRVRQEGRRDYTKQMIRLQQAGQINGTEANEVILLNSHDGTGSYQMLAGMYRFVCKNDLVCGGTFANIRIPHRGNVVDQVIEAAFHVVQGFERVAEARESMRAVTLSFDEMQAFGCAALAVKYGADMPVGVTERSVLMAQRDDDKPTDLWTVFNRVQENLLKGGLRSAVSGRRARSTRAVQGISSNLRINQGLWSLADAMRRIKS